MHTLSKDGKPTRQWWEFSLAIVLLFLVGTFTFANLTPEIGALLPKCLIRSLFDINCPGCGITRALHALTNGEAWRAFTMNPLFIGFSTPVGIAFFLDKGFDLKSRFRPIKILIQIGTSARAWCFLIISFTIVRNIPLKPFNLLAPGGML